MRRDLEFSNESVAERLERLVEGRVRILCVADRDPLAVLIRRALEKALGDFELAVESALDRAAERIECEPFDLLLLDLGLTEVRRSTLMDHASELATRLPVVALSGTESIGRGAPGGSRSPDELLEEADLAAVLHRTLRRARRLGTFGLPPVFCRLERFGTSAVDG